MRKLLRGSNAGMFFPTIYSKICGWVRGVIVFCMFVCSSLFASVIRILYVNMVNLFWLSMTCIVYPFTKFAEYTHYFSAFWSIIYLFLMLQHVYILLLFADRLVKADVFNCRFSVCFQILQIQFVTFFQHQNIFYQLIYVDVTNVFSSLDSCI